MGMRYGATGNESTTTSGDTTILRVSGGAAVVVSIYDLMVGSDATPADTALIYSVAVHTDAGTEGAAVVPEPLDAAIGLASEADVGSGDFSVEPTYPRIPVIELPVNQRASYRWVAAPGGELRSPVAAGDGWSALIRAASFTGSVYASMHWEE